MEEKKYIWEPEVFKQSHESVVNGSIIFKNVELKRNQFFIDEFHLNQKDIFLDGACGYGRFSKLISNDVCKIVGLDINQRNLEFAKQYVSSNNFETMLVDLSKGSLPFKSNEFDKILFENIFVFFEKERVKQILQEADRILKPNGILAFSIENSTFIFSPLRFLINSYYQFRIKIKGEEYGVKNYISPLFVQKELKKMGYEVIIQGDTFYFLNKVAGINLIPKMFHPILARLDEMVCKTWLKYFMASCSIVGKK